MRGGRSTMRWAVGIMLLLGAACADDVPGDWSHLLVSSSSGGGVTTSSSTSDPLPTTTSSEGGPSTSEESTGTTGGSSSSGSSSSDDGSSSSSSSGSSSSSSTSDDGSSSSSGGPIDPGYGDCANMPPGSVCLPQENCLVDGMLMFGVCSDVNCTTELDCPPAPAGGTAPVACVDFTGGGSTECILSCAMGETCPAGMSCFAGEICAWAEI